MSSCGCKCTCSTDSSINTNPSSVENVNMYQNGGNLQSKSGCLEDRLLQMERTLCKATQSLKTKEALIKLQSEQLKKMEDMYKKCLDENEHLNYANKKTCHDLENLKIILKQYEAGKGAKCTEKGELDIKTSALTEQYQNLHESLVAQENKIESILKICTDKFNKLDSQSTLSRMTESRIESLEEEKKDLAKEKMVMQEVISTLLVEIDDLRGQLVNMKSINAGTILVDEIIEYSVKYVEQHQFNAKTINPATINSDPSIIAVQTDESHVNCICLEESKSVMETKESAVMTDKIRSPEMKDFTCTCGIGQINDEFSEDPPEMSDDPEFPDVSGISEVNDKLCICKPDILKPEEMQMEIMTLKNIIENKDDEIKSLKNQINKLEKFCCVLEEKQTAALNRTCSCGCLEQAQLLMIKNSELWSKNKNLCSELCQLKIEKESLILSLKTLKEELINCRKNYEGEIMELQKESDKKNCCVQFVNDVEEYFIKDKEYLTEEESSEMYGADENEVLRLENEDLKLKIQQLEDKLFESRKFKKTCLENIAELKNITTECKSASMLNVIRTSLIKEKDVEFLQEELAQANLRLEEFSKKEEALKSENEMLKMKFNQALENEEIQAGGLRSQINQIEEELKITKQECCCLQQYIQELKSELQSSKTDTDLMKKQYNCCKKDLIKLQEQLNRGIECERCKREIKKMQALLEKSQASKEKYFDVVKQLSKEKEHCDCLIAENEKLCDRCCFLESKLNKVKKIKERTTERLNEFKYAAEQLKQSTKNELQDLNLEVGKFKELYLTLKTPQKQFKDFEVQNALDVHSSAEDMKRIIDECERYKEKLEIMNQKIDSYIQEHTTYKQQSEKQKSKLMQENEELKCKLKISSIMSNSPSDTSIFSLTCDNPDKTIIELEAMIKQKESEIKLNIEQLERAKIVLDNVKKYKHSRICCPYNYALSESDSTVSLDCSAAIYSVQTNIQNLLTNLQQQREEYGCCNQEMQIREEFLTQKICDIEKKKNTLLKCLTTINSSLEETTRNETDLNDDENDHSDIKHCCTRN